MFCRRGSRRRCGRSRSSRGERHDDRETALRIRAGDIRPGDVAALEAAVEAKLSLASPSYLERYG